LVWVEVDSRRQACGLVTSGPDRSPQLAALAWRHSLPAVYFHPHQRIPADRRRTFAASSRRTTGAHPSWSIAAAFVFNRCARFRSRRMC